MSTTNSIRATFVMRRGSRDLLKGVARRYKVSQSEIMNVAPYLFIIIAERSLNERRAKLENAKVHAEQAYRALELMRPHLVVGDADFRIEQAIALEERSIAENQVHGPSESNIYESMGRAFSPSVDPFSETLKGALVQIGANATVARFGAMLNEDHDNDSFLDEEEEEERDARLKEVFGDLDLNLEDSPREPTKLNPSDGTISVGLPGPRVSRWQIIIKGRELSAESGADALEKFLKYLVEEDKDALDKIRSVRGRIRPLIANTTEQLYPGRADLAANAREFIRGWFVGTNYSHRDVMRLLRGAAESAGLVWGVDVYVKVEEGHR